jgi:hypothetical protein
MIRDRDGIYGDHFRCPVQGLGIGEVSTSNPVSYGPSAPSRSEADAGRNFRPLHPAPCGTPEGDTRS